MSTIGGRYRLEGRLGVGGMSTVMLAFDDRLERYVALKLLAEHLADDPTFVSRFRREALSAARLIHPNIVQVYDFGLDKATNQHFIVMEHVPGHSCAELLRDRGHLDVAQAVEIVTQACRGLDYAHRNGVIHRDVKPGNLLVSESGVTKLADFGIARAANQSSITQVGSVLGTAAYLAPEQGRGELAGPRADLYSLGVVTYQLLSGRLPYEAGSLAELALKQQRESPVPLGRMMPTVPGTLADVVEVAIAIDPEERPADALAFAEMVREGARGVSPFEELPTRAATAQTRALPARGAVQTAATRVATGPRRAAAAPRQVPVGRSPAGPSPYAGPRAAALAAEARRDDRRGGRVLLAVVALVVLAAIVGVIAAALGNSSSHVHLRQVVAHDVQSAIDQLKSLISQNTAGR